jgi:hypothetical protein
VKYLSQDGGNEHHHCTNNHRGSNANRRSGNGSCDRRNRGINRRRNRFFNGRFNRCFNRRRHRFSDGRRIVTNATDAFQTGLAVRSAFAIGFKTATRAVTLATAVNVSFVLVLNTVRARNNANAAIALVAGAISAVVTPAANCASVSADTTAVGVSFVLVLDAV